MNDPRELLAATQDELESFDYDEELHRLDRRDFLFVSLIAAAASAFGVDAAVAQGGATAQQQAPVPLPLGNGEPMSWTFQPYPGGTGALMEKLIRERGGAAFERSPFVVEKWSGPVPTSEEEIAFLPAHRISALIKERKLTSSKVTEIYLARLKRLDPTLLCVVTLMESQARAEAARADAEIKAGKYRGPLHGVPYGVKDLFNTKGVPTTWGSADFANRIIDDDAEVVVRLREAGAVLLAKLSTGLFAQGDQWSRGRTNNPWDTRRGSSGSSAGPASATAAGCVAFGIGTETQGSIVSPARECGLSALRPTFGRVSRAGGMVLAWSMDRVGPICRTIEDCALVFNTIHGVDPKDPGTVTTPFKFDRNIKLASLRIGYDAAAPKEFLDKLRELGANPRQIGPRPAIGPGTGSALAVESSAAFDAYVQMKAKEFGIDSATLPEPTAGRGGGVGGRGAAGDSAGRGGRGGVDSVAGRGGAPGAAGGGGGGRGDPGNPTGTAALTRWTGGRFQRAFDFVQSQRRRYLLISQMAEQLKDLDMYIPQLPGGDVGLHAQTGHPCAVVPYKYEPQPSGRGGGAAPIVYKAQPICAVLAGNLYQDDKILSVAHQYQVHTEWHLRHPEI